MLKGDTVRLKCYFRTFKGNLIEPSNVTLTIFKDEQTEIESFILNDTHKQEEGVYFYDYTPSSELKELNLDSFIFEFKGIYNDKPIIVRDSVEMRFC